MADVAHAATIPAATVIERLDLFMARANSAYYAARDPFADFTTAPEISQVFGELLGLWAAVVWQQMGKPAPVILAEAGPGRGTLMADALRAIGKTMPDFSRALRLHLVETSPRLRALQAERLPGASWHDDFTGLPEGPLLLLANEFFDALPIRQFVRRGTGWTERHVRDGSFFEFSSIAPPRHAEDGEIVEICEPALAFASTLGRRIATTGGAALLIDYGPERSAPGDSLQAVRDGRPADPLAEPGLADLTAHVDFQAMSETACAAGAAVHAGPVPQGAMAPAGTARLVPAHRRARPHAATGARRRHDRRGAAVGRTRPYGTAVQGTGALPPCAADPTGIRAMTAEAVRATNLPFRHGFFTRRGGVSEGPFASLNCSLSGRDVRHSVLENRARAAQALGADPGSLVGLTQVHSATAVRVEAPWIPGAGPRADAAVTDRPGIALGIVTADCAPVLFADATAGVIGAAHAGWRGAVAGVLEATLAAMVALGAEPSRVSAAIGPCIGQASYEIAADLRDAVLARDHGDVRFFSDGVRPERWQFDLGGYCAARLAAAGVGGVEFLGLDTVALEESF